MAFTPAGIYGANQNGLFGVGAQPTSFSDYAYAAGNQGFGVNAAYLTPNYTNAYRPPYGGDDGYPNPYQTRPSLSNSAWYLSSALPFPGSGFGTDVPYYQNPVAARDYAVNNLTTSVGDAGATAMQTGLTFASVIAANKLMNSDTFRATGPKARMQAAFGMGAKEGLGARLGGIAGRSVGAGVGGIAGGASRALIGYGSVGGGAAAFGSMGALAGGVVGGLAGSIIAGQAIYDVSNKLVIDPYVQTRRGAEILKSQLSGQALAEGGDVSGGFGISSQRAYDISSSINKLAQKDFAFKDSDYTAMLDYSMQAGLLDSLGENDFNAKKVTDQVKKIAKDVKTIMTVFGEADMREAVGILSKFSKMGFGPGTAEAASGMSSLRMASAYSGKSAKEIMETVFTPGAYAFQSQSLNGVIGGAIATDTFRGYQAALKNGLISKSMLASMGGAEGASQLAVSGILRLAQSEFNQMSAYNQFFGTNKGSGVAGELNAFAANMGGDPVKTRGRQVLLGNQILDEQLKENRFAPLLKQVDVLRQLQPGKKVDLYDLAAQLSANGLSDEEVRAQITDLKSTMTSDVSGLAGRTYNQDVRQYMSGENLAFSNIAAISAARGIYSAFKSNLSAPGDAIASLTASASDSLSKFFDEQAYRTSKVVGNVYDEEAMMGFSAGGAVAPDRLARSRASAARRTISAQGGGRITQYGLVKGTGNESAVKAVNFVNKYTSSTNAKFREAAQNVIRGNAIDAESYVNLQKVTGDYSVGYDVVSDAAAGGAKYGISKSETIEAAKASDFKQTLLKDMKLAGIFTEKSNDADKALAIVDFADKVARATPSEAAMLLDKNPELAKELARMGRINEGEAGLLDRMTGKADTVIGMAAKTFFGIPYVGKKETDSQATRRLAVRGAKDFQNKISSSGTGLTAAVTARKGVDAGIAFATIPGIQVQGGRKAAGVSAQEIDLAVQASSPVMQQQRLNENLKGVLDASSELELTKAKSSLDTEIAKTTKEAADTMYKAGQAMYEAATGKTLNNVPKGGQPGTPTSGLDSVRSFLMGNAPVRSGLRD